MQPGAEMPAAQSTAEMSSINMFQPGAEKSKQFEGLRGSAAPVNKNLVAGGQRGSAASYCKDQGVLCADGNSRPAGADIQFNTDVDIQDGRHMIKISSPAFLYPHSLCLAPCSCDLMSSPYRGPKSGLSFGPRLDDGNTAPCSSDLVFGLYHGHGIESFGHSQATVQSASTRATGPRHLHAGHQAGGGDAGQAQGQGQGSGEGRLTLVT